MRSYKKLPREIQHLYGTQEGRFLKNPHDPRLHIKRLKEFPHVLSLRITRNYRTLFYFKNPDTAVFFDIDHRKDIYR
ncbi:MAG: hypothetical protein Q7J22_00025 [Candidatus Wolfebacteria bacterium]|nr:hypothetical protein [Candidatus Wolfebacteria bacterium]